MYCFLIFRVNVSQFALDNVRIWISSTDVLCGFNEVVPCTDGRTQWKGEQMWHRLNRSAEIAFSEGSGRDSLLTEILSTAANSSLLNDFHCFLINVAFNYIFVSYI